MTRDSDLSSPPRLLAIAAAILFAAIVAFRAAAMNLYSYDLDSLVFMSSDIVAATVTQVTDNRASSINVKVSACFAGHLEPGQAICVAATDFFSTRGMALGHDTSGSGHLAVGDHLFLFLVTATKQFLFDPPAGAYMPVPSGVKVVVDDKVCGFIQYSNPGPYCLERPSDRNKDILPSNETYPKLIAEAKRRVDGWRDLLAKPAKPTDTFWLLQLLKERQDVSRKDWAYTDAVTEAAASRLANLHDPAAACEAIALPRPPPALYRAFGTPEGREFLLKNIADAGLPKATRLRLTLALRESGEVYRSTLTNITSNSWKPDGVPDAANSHYLTRVAKLALDNVDEEELCISIIDGLEWYARWTGSSRKPGIQVDLDGAAPLLAKLRDKTGSEGEKYAVEKALREIGREQSGTTKTRDGPILCLIKRPVRNNYMAPDVPSLIFEYDFRSFLSPAEQLPFVQTILEPIAGGKLIVLPANQAVAEHAGAMGGGGDSVAVPADTPAGKYKVYYRFVRGDQTIGVSYGFTVTLPDDLIRSNGRVEQKSKVIGLNKWFAATIATVLVLTAVGVVICRFGLRPQAS